ncbi:RIP metalloprotease RseP [Chitinophaga sp.]|uniref:RIP metalloprotease RseP n=1 Tax=Chitinophaga sp. TaxID=1869181 RepID=UPI0031D42F94
METALVKWGSFILSLSLLIVLHEMGHFVPAKAFKTRVSKFYLFFDFLFPVSGWLKFSLLKFKRGETEYGIGWFPLGGYVQIEGMVDEQMNTEQLQQPPQPWEFRSKPAWQRLIIMAGGILVNLLVGILIYTMIAWYWGKQTLPAHQLTYGISAGTIARESGLRDGDQIISLDKEPVQDFNTITKSIILGEAHSMQVLRDGQQLDIAFSPSLPRELIHAKGQNFIAPRIPAVTGTITAKSIAEKSGLLPGDKILSVNGIPVTYYHEFQQQLQNTKEKTLQLQVSRKGQSREIRIPVVADQDYGISSPNLQSIFTYDVRTYSLSAALAEGTRMGINALSDYIRQIKMMFSGDIKLSESLGGFGSIASLFPSSWNWLSFWRITAFLSFILAFMNLLPIPGLDGGHIMFLLYEMFSGRQPHIKVMEYSQLAGMLLIFGLLLYSNGLDILRALKITF